MRIGFLGVSDSKESACNAGGTRDVGSLGQEVPLEEEMASHSSIAWRIPWTEEPGGLQSMGSQSRTLLTDSHTPTLMRKKASTCSHYSSFPPFETLDSYLSPPR